MPPHWYIASVARTPRRSLSTRRPVQIRTSAPLDYETKRIYRVNVVATDSSKASQSVGVTININNVEEPLSVVTGDAAVDYAEDRTDAVAAYSATDPDGTPVTWESLGWRCR